MTAEERPISDEDLHAYVDGFLDPEQRAAVDRYLRVRPEIARRVAAYGAQRDDLRRAFASRAEEPIPALLNLSRLAAEQLALRRPAWRTAAAIALAFGLGGVGGWYFGARLPTGIDALVREATASYAVYASDKRRPVELWAAQRDDLARWLSNRLGRPVAPPDLSGVKYQLLGGRLVATEHGPAALFMYENEHGTRLALFVRPMTVGHSTPIENVQAGAVDGYAWIDRGIGYTVIADESHSRLQQLSEHVKQQIGAPG